MSLCIIILYECSVDESFKVFVHHLSRDQELITP